MSIDIIDIARELSKRTVKDLLKPALEDSKTESELVQMNTRQLARFEDSEGVKLADIGGEYSKTTQSEKGLGPRDVNLNDTGEFWASIEVEPLDDGYKMDADTVKNGVDLRIRWGKNIIGIQDEKEAERIIEKSVWNKFQEGL